MAQFIQEVRLEDCGDPFYPSIVQKIAQWLVCALSSCERIISLADPKHINLTESSQVLFCDSSFCTKRDGGPNPFDFIALHWLVRLRADNVFNVAHIS